MESNLKRLWTRRRSTRDSSPDLGTVGLPKSKGTGISSASYKPSRPVVTVTNGDNPTTSSPPATDIANRPDSSNKAQPTLLGVTRADASLSRPSSPGSILNAVNRAADRAATTDNAKSPVLRAENEFKRSAQKYTQVHSKSATPRYLDIFSMSNAPRPQSSMGYNEDVAERNLDLAKVALDGAEPEYVPSRYQEDVASRNAFPPLPELPFRKRSFSSPDEQIRRQLSHMPSHLTINTSKGTPVSSDTFPKSPGADPAKRVSDTLTSQSDTKREIVPVPASEHKNTGFIVTRAPLVALNHKSTKPDGREGADSVEDGKTSSPLSAYQLSPTEMTHVRYSERSVDPRQGTSYSQDGSITSKRPPSTLRRSASAMSNSSSVKRSITLANRTIMDLTGEDDDVFSEGSPKSSFSDPPVIDGHKPESILRFQTPLGSPRSVGGHSSIPSTEVYRKDSVPTVPTPDVVRAIAEVTPPRGQEQLPSTETKPDATSNKPKTQNTFSVIGTIASLTPRNSLIHESGLDIGLGELTVDENQSPSHPSDPQQPVTATILPDTHAVQGPPPQAVKESDGKLPTPNGSSPDASIQIQERNVASDKGEPHDSLAGPAKFAETAQRLGQLNSNNAAGEAPAAPLVRQRSLTVPETSQSQGVSTRDFASLPLTSANLALATVPEDKEPQLSFKPSNGSQPRSRSVSYDTPSALAAKPRPTLRSPLYQATFDEAEFANKQAEARAALIRLQQSLNETFLAHPPVNIVQSSKPRNSSKHSLSHGDGRPVAPTSIFAQIRHSPNPSTETEPRVGSDSYGARGQEFTNVSAPATMHNSLNQESSNHKQPVLDGPGPTVLSARADQEAEESLNLPPLPLPPPLPLNGAVLSRVGGPPVPPSPGEISLSNFPMPISSPRNSANPNESVSTYQQHLSHARASSAGAAVQRAKRPASEMSQASNVSTYSIPVHMVPERGSSMRDRSVADVEV